jgi:hypothetical protein
MKGSTQAALALGAGYVLGRRRKMRMAAMLAGATAVGGIGGLGGSVLRRGATALGSTELLGKVAPQLGDMADTVRGDLLDAGKAAALAAVTGRIDSLTDSLHERAETFRAPAERAAGQAAETAQGLRRRARPSADDEREAPADEQKAEAEGRPDDFEDDDFEDDDYEDEDHEDDDHELDDAEESEADEPEAAPVRRRTPRGRPAASGARR